jgi:homoserine kinase
MSGVRLRLPATSANLGPGFDTLAVALRLHLSLEARAASAFSVEASGRNADLCGATENNLLIETYRTLLLAHNRPVVPLHIDMENEIPLGMGCGSSAAVRLAAAALAGHFGELGWNRERILAEACRLEGHPDNAAACWLGGLVACAPHGEGFQAISMAPPAAWRAVIAMPAMPLATTVSRAVLPEHYSREDVVANLQRVALLTAAFATGRADVMANAMSDRLHQPYRSEVCPLLNRLLPLTGLGGIAGVALSGAGPAVLLLTISEAAADRAQRSVLQLTQSMGEVEVVIAAFELEPAACDQPR